MLSGLKQRFDHFVVHRLPTFDQLFKHIGVVAEPVISEHTVRSKDEVLVGASDGVWSVLPSDKAMALVDAVARRQPGGFEMHASQCAQELVTASARR